jgi:ABC-type multidrug transport system fused ATPase/permease subunit
MTGGAARGGFIAGFARLYGTFWREARGVRRAVLLFLALLSAAQVVRLSAPWFFGEAVNRLQASSGQDLGGAGRAVALAFGAFALAWVAHGPARVIERLVAIRVRERFVDRLYAKAVSLPLRWHERNHSGQTIQRIERSTAALSVFAQNQFVYLQDAIGLVGPVLAIAALSPATGAAAFLGYGLIAAVLVRFDRVMLRLIEEENAADRRFRAELGDCLGNVSTVQTLRLQRATREAVARRYAEVSKPLRRNVVVNEAKWCAIDVMNHGLRAGLVVLYAWLSWREAGAVALGTAVMVHQYAQQAGQVVGSLAMNWSGLVRHMADIRTADAVLDAEGRPGSADGAPGAALPAAPPADWHEISVAGLCFRHLAEGSGAEEGGGAGLDEVALTFRRGRRIALVGESGSGKSTLMRVLAGLYPADRVAVSVDGAPRPELRDLGSIATLIPQDAEVFEASLGRNLTLGLDYPEAAVRRACEIAGLGPVLERLPGGLDARVSERGLNLSGGQKQRLALARGVLASFGSGLVMLDEPTSALDPATEARVYDALMAEFRDACLVSSIHRMHLLHRFDLVVMMEGGRVVDMGPPEEMAARHRGLGAGAALAA